MNSWLDLEDRFRQLCGPLLRLRLDIQSGSSGEYWNVTGMQRTADVQQFETLAGVAGRMLELSFTDKEEPEKTLLKEKNPRIRWYRTLKELSGEFQPELPATELDTDGNATGHLYIGSLHNVVATSANLCLTLHVDHPVQDERTFLQRLYDDYGREIVIGVILALITAIIGLFFG